MSDDLRARIGRALRTEAGLCTYPLLEPDHALQIAWPLIEQALASERPQWQPIATAPKDGTLILVGTSKWFAMSNFCSDGSWWTWHPPLRGERPSPLTSDGQPTHWMPLPPAPASVPDQSIL